VFCRNVWTDRARFWHEGFLRHVVYCVIKKFRCLQNKDTSVQNTSSDVLNSGLSSCPALDRHVMSSSRQRWILSAINWTVVGQRCLQQLRRLTASLSHWSSTSVYSTIRRAGSSATADNFTAQQKFESIPLLPIVLLMKYCIRKPLITKCAAILSNGIHHVHPPDKTSLCPAFYVSWQSDTARICCCPSCCCGARRPPLSIDISCPPGPQQQPAAPHAEVAKWNRRTDGHRTVT